MKRFIKNNSGITMMEVLITVAILAIVVVPCLSSFVVAQRGNVLAKQTTEAYTQASNLMETLKGVQVAENVEPTYAAWLDAVKSALTKYNESTEVITAFIEQGEDGEPYLIVSVYAGELDAEPTDVDPILKGVIAP